MVQPRPSGVCSKSSGRGAPARWRHDRARVCETVTGRHRHAEAWEQVPGAAHRLSTAFGVDEVGKCIASLMDTGMMIPASIQSEDPTEEYRIALTGMLIHGRRTVFVGLKRGEYKLQNRSFLPISSEMAAMANLECRSLREERMRLGDDQGWPPKRCARWPAQVPLRA